MRRTQRRPTDHQVATLLEPIARAADAHRDAQLRYRAAVVAAYEAGVLPTHIAEYAGIRLQTALGIVRRAAARSRLAPGTGDAPDDL